MILVWGPPGDDTTLAVLDALERRQAPTVFINQAEVLSHDFRLDVDCEVRARLDLGSSALDLSDASAVYLRPYNSSDAPAVAINGALSEQAFHARRIDALLLRWAEVTPAHVINRPSATASNGSKPVQALAAREVGFEVPDTLLTTDPDEVRRFAAAHEAVVYKSISSVRSIVTQLREQDMERLDDVTWCPSQFQERVPGTDVRAHVVGDGVLACEIESDADDYRYGESTMRPYELPRKQVARCRALARQLGLDVAGIDLRRTPNRRWYCFEANPSPAFAHFGAETKMAVADALAERLINAPGPRPFAVAFAQMPGPPEPAPDPPADRRRRSRAARQPAQKRQR